MSEPDAYSYPQYLSAKKAIDDRSLNQRVWTCFLEDLLSRGSSLRILEVGGGVGATVQRLVAALETRNAEALHYTFVERAPNNVNTAISALQTWATERGYQVTSVQNGNEQEQHWSNGPLEATLRFVTADLYDINERSSYDAVVAQALFDLLDIPRALQVLRPSLQAGGLWYLPIHFDGVTAFEPPTDPSLDARVERLYHESMQEGGGQGEIEGAHSGRRLLGHLQNVGASLLEVGGSDWCVFPGPSGYSSDEAYFLHHILHFIEEELTGHPDLEESNFSKWINTRRHHIETEQLIYIAHQLDLLARMP